MLIYKNHKDRLKYTWLNDTIPHEKETNAVVPFVFSKSNVILSLLMHIWCHVLLNSWLPYTNYCTVLYFHSFTTLVTIVGSLTPSSTSIPLRYSAIISFLNFCAFFSFRSLLDSSLPFHQFFECITALRIRPIPEQANTTITSPSSTETGRLFSQLHCSSSYISPISVRCATFPWLFSSVELPHEW